MKQKMRNYFTLCAIIAGIFIFSTAARAQTEIGFKAGTTEPGLLPTGIYNPLSSSYDWRIGLDAAVHIEFNASKRFSFQTELEYSSQGGKKIGDQAFGVPPGLAGLFGGAPPQALYANFKSSTHLNYLQIPLLLKYHFAKGENAGFYAAAGPYVGYLLSARNVSSGTGIVFLDAGETQALSSTIESFDSSNSIKSQFNNFNVGVEAIIGISHNVSTGKIFAEAGCGYGLIGVQKTVAAYGQNNTLTGFVRVGYQFKLKAKKEAKAADKK